MSRRQHVRAKARKSATRTTRRQERQDRKEAVVLLRLATSRPRRKK